MKDRSLQGDASGRAVVFLDIDNTIWDSDFKIPQGVREALLRLHENGHQAYINSGRARAFIRDEALLTLSLDGIIAGCGCHIETGDLQNGGELLYEKCISFELADKVRRLFMSQHMPVIFEGPDYHWMNPADAPHDFYIARVWDELGEYARYPEELREGDRVNKFSAVITETTDFEAVRKELDGEVEFLFHNPKIFEAIPKGTGKAFGIRKLMELTGIRHEDTYAIGDSVNDKDMLEYAAHGICMGNGSDEVKAVADYVTSDIHEDGLVNALKHFGLI